MNARQTYAKSVVDQTIMSSCAEPLQETSAATKWVEKQMQMKNPPAKNSHRHLIHNKNPNRIRGHEKCINQVQPPLIKKRKWKPPKPVILTAT